MHGVRILVTGISPAGAVGGPPDAFCVLGGAYPGTTHCPKIRQRRPSTPPTDEVPHAMGTAIMGSGPESEFIALGAALHVQNRTSLASDQADIIVRERVSACIGNDLLHRLLKLPLWQL